MPKVLLMEFNKDQRRFNALRDVELSSVPTSGDKIAINIDDIGYMFKVYDVHYGDNNMTDVNVIRLSTVTEYYSSRYPDID